MKTLLLGQSCYWTCALNHYTILPQVDRKKIKKPNKRKNEQNI